MSNPYHKKFLHYNHLHSTILTHASLINPSPYGNLQLLTCPLPHQNHQQPLITQAYVVLLTREPHQCRILDVCCAVGGEIAAIERLLEKMEERTAGILGEMWDVGVRRGNDGAGGQGGGGSGGGEGGMRRRGRDDRGGRGDDGGGGGSGMRRGGREEEEEVREVWNICVRMGDGGDGESWGSYSDMTEA